MNRSFSEEEDRVRKIASGIVQRKREYIRSVIRSREIQQYAGFGVQCPVCLMEFSSFAPIYKWRLVNDGNSEAGTECAIESDEGRCPNCDSLHRQRLLWKYIHERTNLLSGKRVKLMEVAPDLPFFNLFNNNPGIRYYPCDIAPGKEKYLYFPGKIKDADITHLPFESKYFDVILCSHVLEHVVDDISAMKEMFRVLRGGGWVLIQSPVFYNIEKTLEDPDVVTPEGRELKFGQLDHLRKYGRDFKNRLSNSGFTIDEIDYVNSFPEEDIKRFGFDRYERIYLCRKY